MKTLLVAFTIFSIFFQFSAQAADLSGHFGVGLGKSILDRTQFERMGRLGISYGKTWRVQANVGYYMDPRAFEQSSVFASLQGAVKVKTDGGAFCTVAAGPAYLHRDGGPLSGHLQFHESFGCGVEGNGYTLAGLWDHLSNAGIVKGMPNFGRDFITISLTIPIWVTK